LKKKVINYLKSKVYLKNILNITKHPKTRKCITNINKIKSKVEFKSLKKQNHHLFGNKIFWYYK